MGQLSKIIDAHALACLPCRHFRDDDPGIYYCVLQCEEFPGLCAKYQQQARCGELRTEWKVSDDW